ncbi:MAG: monofunctional biosynthetic peptidoglycan transglycosylase [Perlucidibaca sp.]
MKKLLWRLLLIIVGLLLAYQLWLFAHVWWWVDHNPSRSAFMSARLAVMRSDDPEAELHHRWVPYQRISPSLKRAVMAAEDSRFLGHDGFDWEGMQDAWAKNLKKKRIVAGGSTISQQLAKNLFLSGKRTPWRKAEEAAITVMLEQMMEKRRIYEIYLNVIEWGDGVFGAEAAARHYFHKPASALSASEAARLAAMIPNPRYYDAHRSTRYLERRTGIIQRRMLYVRPPR